MTLAEVRELRKGDKVKFSLGNGWYQEASFIKMVQVTYHGKFTLDTIDQIDWRHGRTEWRAECEWVDEKGRKKWYTFRPRSIRKVAY